MGLSATQLRRVAVALIFTLLAVACSTTESAETASDATSETESSQVTASDGDEVETEDEVAEPGEPESEEEATETEADSTDDGDDAVAESDTAGFESASCEFVVEEGFSAECGWVEVPQHWDDPDDPDTIRLHVATITNDQTPADATPVVYLEGGPGGDTFFGLELGLGTQWGEMINNRPLIAFTQRGSALSEIDLECEEVTDESLAAIGRVPDADADFDGQLAALAECADRLIEEGADLTAYNTVSSANDADAIRQALGLSSWNVFGISYGTRLGQELARTHPNEIDALILDSVQPTDPALGSLAAVPGTFQGALDRFFAGCEADAACAELHPNLEERLFAVIEQAAAEPIEVSGVNVLTGEPFDALIDDTRMSGVLFNALYNPAFFGAVPGMIAELEVDETNILGTFIGIQLANSEAVSNGQFNAVICHDYTAELAPDALFQEGLTGDPFFDEVFAGVDAQFDASVSCDAFPSGSADASVTEPVESDIPTLLLSGEYDPITPPSFAEAIAPGFTNGQSVVLPDQGHAVTSSECGLSLAIEFLADPIATVDQSCIDTSPAPPFVAPSLEGITLIPFEEPQLGLTGVRPEEWLDQGFGTTVRNDGNIADQLVLIQQALPSDIDSFLGLFGGQIDAEFVEAAEETVGDRTWRVFEASDSIAGDAIAWAVESDGSTTLAALIGPGESFPDAREHLIPEVLTNLTGP